MFSCYSDYKGVAEYSWVFMSNNPKKSLMKLPHNVKFAQKNSILFISAATSQNAGQYFCTVDTKVGLGRDFATLTVHIDARK